MNLGEEGLDHKMATVLDLGLLQYFTPVFVFFFVFVILWALLEKTRFFGENKFANLAIAMCLSFLFIFIPELTTFVSILTPWFIVLMIFLIFLVLIFLFMGVDPTKVANLFGSNETVIWTILILSIMIFGYAMTQVYGEQIRGITVGSEATDDQGSLAQSVGSILFTPKVLGMLLLLVIAAFAVRFISAANH